MGVMSIFADALRRCAVLVSSPYLNVLSRNLRAIRLVLHPAKHSLTSHPLFKLD